MTTINDYNKRLENAWRDNPDDPQEREVIPDGGVVRRPLQLMDSKPKPAAPAVPVTDVSKLPDIPAYHQDQQQQLKDHTQGRKINAYRHPQYGTRVFVSHTDEERRQLAAVHDAYDKRLQDGWKHLVGAGMDGWGHQ